MKGKKLKKKIGKTRQKLMKVTAKLQKLEAEQARKAADNRDERGMDVPLPVN